MVKRNTNRRVKKTRSTRQKRGTRKNKKPSKKTVAKPAVVGLIYANWCPHCNHMKPDWDEMKNDIQRTNHPITILEIEDSNPNKLATISELENQMNGGKINIDGYPTIFKISGGNITYYQGDRTASKMNDWVRSGNSLTGGYQIDRIKRSTRGSPYSPTHTPITRASKTKSPR